MEKIKLFNSLNDLMNENNNTKDENLTVRSVVIWKWPLYKLLIVLELNKMMSKFERIADS
jgi:hypothetical protein